MNEEELEATEYVEYDDSEFDDQGDELDENLLTVVDDVDGFFFMNDNDELEFSLVEDFVAVDELADESEYEETEEDNVIEEDEEDEE